MRPTAEVIPSGEQEAPGVLSVEAVWDFRSFLDLEPVWNRLSEEAGLGHPFLSHEWVRTWWECFGRGKELHILVVKEGNKALAIAPLMVSQKRLYGFQVRCLEFIYNSHVPRFDFIVARRPEEAYRAVWDYLRQRERLWDVLELCQLPAGSRTLEEVPRLAAADGLLVGLWRSDDSPYLPLGGSWDAYLKSIPRKHRQNLRRRLKRLQELGRVEVEVICSNEELEGVLEEGFRIEGAAWKAEAGTAISSDTATRRFYTQLALKVSRRGWLRLVFLTVQGQRIAFFYGLACHNKYFVLKPGYDPRFSSYSPSNLLYYLLLPKLFAQGLAELDFLGKAEESKLDWTRQVRSHYWLYVLRNKPGLRFLHQMKFGLVPWLQRGIVYPVLRNHWKRLVRRFSGGRRDGTYRD